MIVRVGLNQKPVQHNETGIPRACNGIYYENSTAELQATVFGPNVDARARERTRIMHADAVSRATPKDNAPRKVNYIRGSRKRRSRANERVYYGTREGEGGSSSWLWSARGKARFSYESEAPVHDDYIRVSNTANAFDASHRIAGYAGYAM